MMDKQKVLSKVAKLMALAKSNGASTNEVETALRQARNLMKRYNLEHIEVEAHSVDEVSVVTNTRRHLKTGCTRWQQLAQKPSTAATLPISTR
ncbi:hypothetical protein C4K04_5031 [Pseudomonas chlororaphis]|uniref:DUF2786 domain-containing protein n=1 Tax=Pseudomonas chlororaphis TaxID=587753 RepID=A0A3G7TW91_9PSED|nr:DUF2786 domain-containing protein [Pseudomonas chlororaphis]AZE50682.1 hypothetical protein C4K04_5031 [Pseudomonas chlororaphis]